MSSAHRNEFLIFTDASTARYCYGSDTITNSYISWSRPKRLVDAIAGLSEQQKFRFLEPLYTIGSAMIPKRQRAGLDDISVFWRCFGSFLGPGELTQRKNGSCIATKLY